MYGAIFAGAALSLALELLELRIFSYALDPQLVYVAISAALLGLGAGAMAVVRWPALLRAPALLSGCLSGFAASTLVTLALFARVSPAAGFGPSAGLLFALLLVPYLFAGVLLSAATASQHSDIGRAYLANLAGSALGAVAISPLLRPLGAERLVSLIAALAAATALPLAPSARPRLAAAAALALSLLTLPFASSIFAFQPDPRDLYGVALAAQRKAGIRGLPTLEFSRWDPVSRVEVYTFPGPFGRVDERTPFKLFVQDGGAGSMLVGPDPETRKNLFENTVYGGAYLLKPAPPSALIVGLGGAPDVLAALHHGAQRIHGVELNQSAIDVVGQRYADFLGKPYQQPQVTIHHADGRSFLDRTRERYDVIQMTGADTYAAGSGGAFMFTENYLYTTEAFSRYIQALNPDGVLSIIRFGLEPLRVVTTEIAALRALGVNDPRRHIAVISQGIWVNVLLSRSPLSDEASAALVQSVAERASRPRPRIPVYEALAFGLEKPVELLYAPGHPRNNLYSNAIVAAPAQGEITALAPLALDFAPVSDDHPFFFQHLTAGNVLAILAPSASSDYYLRGLRAHLGFLVAAAALSAALTLGLARGQRPRHALPYFAALGLAYLFVELSVLQKGALFLGHPTYSAPLTLLALLLSSGAGAAWSSRLAGDPRHIARVAALALVPALLLLHPLLGKLLPLLLPLPFAARVAALVLLLLPLGFAMGIPFPSGLRALRAPRTPEAPTPEAPEQNNRSEEAIAWALGVNSFASVLASLVAVPVAMFSGFSFVGAAAALLYGLAAWRAKELGD